MTFTERVEFECLKQGTKYTYVLRDVGIDPTNFIHWRKHNITPEKHVGAIAKALGITESMLMRGVDGRPMKEGGLQYGIINTTDTITEPEEYIITTFRNANFLGKAQLIALSQEMNENGGELKK